MAPKDLKIYPSGRVYRIYDIGHPEQFYIGSTVKTLSQRMTNHRSDCRMNRKMPLYEYIRDNDCMDRMKIELVDFIDRPINKEQLEMIEGRYQRELKPTLNKVIAGAVAMAGGMVEYKKQFYQDHKDEIREQQTKYYQDHKNEIKQYQQEHKKEIKQYYQDHKDEINKHCTCDVCGGKYTNANKAQHERTVKHRKAMEKQNTQ